jgi:preprotein translocase subunit SecF
MVSRRERRLQRLQGRGEQRAERPATAEGPVPAQQRTESLFHRIYNHHYRSLLVISLLLLVLSLAQIGYQTSTTGDFIHKGVSLKGGLTITVPVHDATVSSDDIQRLLNAKYPTNEVIVRGVSELGQLKGLEIEAAAETDRKEDLQSLEQGIVAAVAEKIPTAPKEYSVEVIGPSLGAAFFDQVLRALCIAFILMAMVVFLSFGEHTWSKIVTVLLSLIASFLIFSVHGWLMIAVILVISAALIYLYINFSVPSSYVILCAFSDIAVTVAVVNLLGLKVSTAGVAAFLMLVGYSVDTDILLTTRVLKYKRGTVYERVLSSMKTGLTMSFSTMAAALVGYFVSQSSTIKEIMLIIFIGMIADIIMTWIQNVSLLRMYVDKKGIE